MKNKKELYSINDCETIEDIKELNRIRYQRWYQKNRERKLQYLKEYRKKNK